MGTYGLARLLILKRPAPIAGESFSPCPESRPDRRLLVGAALFGVGWGLGGWCPGPAFVSIAAGAFPLVVFVAAMVAGMGVFALWDQARVRKR